MPLFRIRCPRCGNVQDVPADTACQKCGMPLVVRQGGYLQLYRMGSPVGVAAGYGIYIDGQPYGHLANTQTVIISLPQGPHNVHCTCGMTRKCTDLQFVITPQYPVVYAKAHITMGFWSNSIAVEQANPQDMPPVP